MDNTNTKIILDKKLLTLCYKYTKNCCIGGKSNIRNTRDRSKNLVIDNFIGQVGTLAGCIFILGKKEGIVEYVKAREKADKNPFVGDGGSDLLGYNIDIKCSYMRKSKDPNSYNFLIRPRERHKNWIYIQTLAEKTNNHEMTVHIAGWISDEDIPNNPESSGIFKGAFKIPCSKLNKDNITKCLCSSVGRASAL